MNSDKLFFIKYADEVTNMAIAQLFQLEFTHLP